MASQLFKNNATSTLNGTLSIGATSISLPSGHGNRFPTPSGSDYFYVTLFEKDGSGIEITYEVVKCTARVGDVLTVVRDIEGIVVAAGGTSGGWAFPSAVGVNPSQVVYVELRYTAYAANNTLNKDANLEGIASTATARTNLGLGTIATQNANNVTITGGTISGVTFADSTPIFVDNVDSTKKVQFELGGLTTSTTRTVSFPDASITLPGTNVTNTWGAAQTFSSTINNVTVTAPASAATLTLANNSTLATSGANSITLTSTGPTNVTLPTSGTLLNTSGTAAKATNLVGGNTTTLLGTIPYQSGVDTTTLLAPNTTTTKRFLRQTGTGTNGAAPAWDTLVDNDIPGTLIGKTLQAPVLTSGLTTTDNSSINIGTGALTAGSASIIGGADVQTSVTIAESGTRSLVLKNPTTTLDGEVSTGTNHPLTVAGTTSVTVKVGSLGSRSTIGTFSSAGLAVTGAVSATTTRSYNQSADIGVEIGGTDNGYVDTGAVSHWRQWVSGNASGQSLAVQGFVRGTGYTTYGTWTKAGLAVAAPGVFTSALEAGPTTPILSTVNSNASETQLKIFHSGSTLGIYNARDSNLLLGTNNTTRVTIDQTGNLALGGSVNKVTGLSGSGTGLTVQAAAAPTIAVWDTSDASWYSSFGQINDDAYLYNQSATGSVLFGTNNTERLHLDSAGNLALGTTPSANAGGVKAIEVGSIGSAVWSNGANDFDMLQNAYYNAGWKYAKSSVAAARYEQSSGVHYWLTAPSGTAGNAITFTQAMTLDANGCHLIGTSTNTENYRNNYQFNGLNTNGLLVKNTGSTGTPVFLYLHDSAQTVNSTADCAAYSDSSSARWAFRKNGGLANFSGNDVNLSDRREKTDIEPAGSYLEKVCAIPVVTFNYVDQHESDPGKTLGVIAQDVEAVAPELVMESNWGTPDEPRMRLSIYQTDLQFALMKAIQEQQEIISNLQARLAALEAK